MEKLIRSIFINFMSGIALVVLLSVVIFLLIAVLAGPIMLYEKYNIGWAPHLYWIHLFIYLTFFGKWFMPDIFKGRS